MAASTANTPMDPPTYPDYTYSVSYSIPTAATFRHLRVAGGMSDKTPEACAIGLPKSVFSVQVLADPIPTPSPTTLAPTAPAAPGEAQAQGAEEQPDPRVVAMGRIVGDGALFLQVVDITVHPTHQKRGLGKLVMSHLSHFLDTQVPLSCYVSLLADGEAWKLYKRYGFQLTAPGGVGMRRWIGRKDERGGWIWPEKPTPGLGVPEWPGWRYSVSYDVPSVGTYLFLRKEGGHAEKTREACEVGLPRSVFCVQVLADPVDSAAAPPTASISTAQEEGGGGGGGEDWAKPDPRVVGIGRLIGDAGPCLQVVDMTVLPSHQHRGLGKLIMSELVRWMDSNVPASCYVSLIAEGGAVGLYEKFGFERTEVPGGSVGMRRWVGRREGGKWVR